MLRQTVIVLLLFGLSGCGIVRGIKANSTRDKLNQLEVGMTKSQVLQIMGEPHTREVYGSTEYLLYVTERIEHGYMDIEYRKTPIAFENGILVGWGSDYYVKPKERIDADINIYNK